MNKKIIISLIILITLCCAGTIVVMAGLYFTSLSSISTLPAAVETLPPLNTEAVNLPPQPLDTPMPANPPKVANNAMSSIPAKLSREMDEIQQQVIGIRGLQARQPVTRALITKDELQQKVETEFFKDYSALDAKEDVVVLSILGLLPEGFDLLGLYKNLYSEQIAGFYDSETKEMYVVQGEDFSGVERMTYAHEYTHTLQDQVYDLENGLKVNQEYCKNETEYCSAVTALIEGDAVHTEQEWLLTYAGQQDKQSIQEYYLTYSSPVFDSTPDYLKKDFLFPYQFGLEFVYSLKDRGGYALVDQAFHNPPVTTEQILHPDKFPTDKPVEVTLPDLQSILPETWKKVDDNELGEWYSYLVLAHGRDTECDLPEATAKTAAAGWGGDRYVLFSSPSGKEIVFLMQSEWDTENDAVEFITAMKQYGQKRWGNPIQKEGDSSLWTETKDGTVFIDRHGSTTLWLIAPDESTRLTIQSILPAFPA